MISIDVEHRMRELREKLCILREQYESSFDAQTSRIVSTNNTSAQMLIAAENDFSFASNNDNNFFSFLLLFQLFSTINKKLLHSILGYDGTNPDIRPNAEYPVSSDLMAKGHVILDTMVGTMVTAFLAFLVLSYIVAP